MQQASGASFGLDDFGLDDRMRLFSYVTADNRVAYLWMLRAFDNARASYHVMLHTSEVAAAMEAGGASGIYPIEDHEYGRGGRLRDPWGIQWMLMRP